MGGKIICIVALLVLCATVGRQADAAEALEASAFDTLLKKYVADGAVDYLTWKKHDLAAFERYINSLAHVPVTDVSADEQKAFWINTYNAITIYAVLKRISANRVLAQVFSVQMVPGFFDKITYAVAGETLTLDDIEHKKLMEAYRDPRIHFAIVCASRSCSKINPVVFTAEGLDEQLERAARDFIRDTTRNRLDQKNNVLHLSEIFRWYESDFVAEAGSVPRYIKKFVAPQDEKHLDNNTPVIKYLFYNWLANIKR